jgi:hypothetical protein
MPDKKVLDNEISSFFLFREQFWPAWIQIPNSEKCHSINMARNFSDGETVGVLTVLGIQMRMFLGHSDPDPSLFS